MYHNIQTCLLVYAADSGGRLQDHWSSGCLVHQIVLKFSGNDIVALKYFYDVDQTVRNYDYFFENKFSKLVFFGLLQVPIMALSQQSIFLNSMDIFLSNFDK